ncbi:MAG: glucose-6-phosphate isomerase [Gemmatimonadaceae bacterium]|jgi:glucose-6-phosphate isomerase|nr:glucose-6-phosphate isomerase [Gemmatimonadaceae bacterium]
MPLRLDFSNMMADTLGQAGIRTAQFEGARAAFATAHAGVAARHAAGQLGFIDLPDDAALLAQSTDFAARVAGRYDDVLVLGIGGSALGPIALRTALRPGAWNMRSAAQRGGLPRLVVLDNVDPVTIAETLALLDLSRTLVVVTSKSGGTVETMAQYLIVRDALTRTVGAERVRDHLVFITDPKSGALRPLAVEQGIPALDIPPNVGGRFSVFTPVGMLPAALIGIDVRGMLDGARALRDRCAAADLATNPAGAFAVLQWLADREHRANVQVLMPYVDAFRDLGAWFVQLWAESLGKLRPDGTSVGPTPLGALGATDQHSQVQLFMEGPKDKTITFVGVRERASQGAIPTAAGDGPELAYLAGHSLAELIDVEQRATAGALAARGKMNMTLTVDRADAFAVGELMMCFELATAYAGELYGVDAFNQPGVELGKRYAYGMLGRSGYEAAKAEFAALPAGDARWRVG